MKRKLLSVALAFIATLWVSAQVRLYNGAQIIDNMKMERKTSIASNVVKPAKMAGSNEIKKANDFTNVVATGALSWYYGDLFGTGGECHLLFLSNAGIDNTSGLPYGEGQMLRILINSGTPSEEPDNPMLPTGTFSYNADKEPNTFYSGDTDFIDAWIDSTDPSNPLLKGNIYKTEGGSITINKDEDNKYTITADLSLILINPETQEVVLRKPLHITYEGLMEYESKVQGDLYTPIPAGEYTMNIPNASGRYTNGNYSIAFYNVPLDADGFIAGAGELFSVEFIVPDSYPMNISELAGVYKFYSMEDAINIGLEEYTFLGGYMMEVEEGFYYPIGTCLSIYNEDTELSQLGLAASGTITVTDKGNGIMHFKFDTTTPENAHLTGEWEGKIADYITDMSTGIEDVTGIKANIEVKDGHIIVKNTEYSRIEICGINGVSIASHNNIKEVATKVTPGLYLVKVNGETTKVLVK